MGQCNNNGELTIIPHGWGKFFMVINFGDELWCPKPQLYGF